MNEEIKTKVCSDCNIEKPISEFSMRPNYNKSKVVYHRSMCKRCAIVRTVAWKLKNPERYKIYNKEYYAKIN